MSHRASIYAVRWWFILLALLFSAENTLAQNAASDARAQVADSTHLELPQDLNVARTQTAQQTSRAYRFASTEISTAQVNVDEFGLNIVDDAANEPSLAVDPTNSNRMVIGWRQFDTINSNFRQAGYGFTQDGGVTWTFPGVIEPGIFRSDPVLDADAFGNFYYNSLTVSGGAFSCQVFKSSDGGASAGNIYAYWTQSFSVCAPGFFTRSVNRGESFENCAIIPEESLRWGTLAIGPEGELYVGGISTNGFTVAKSLTAREASAAVTWSLVTPVNLGGSAGLIGGGPNPGGLLGQVWIAVDQSTSALRGNVYLLCSVQRAAVGDPRDVMFAASTDGGATWSAPVRINDDSTNSAWQWFGTMSVAPNGRIDVVWLDTRDDLGGFNSALYYAHSFDGGVTWSKNERLSEAFDPHLGWPRQNKIGDYFHMVSENEHAHLAWAATFNGEQDVYYSRIALGDVAVRETDFENAPTPSSATLAQNYPNPFNPTTTINFTLAHSGAVQLKILNDLGIVVRVLMQEEKSAGAHTAIWDGRNDAGARLASGLYFYTLTLNKREVITKRLIMLQ